MQHLMVYGNGNAERLLQQRKLSSALRMSWGLEARSASLRIPHSTFLQQCGWYEDRRPASNMDPYLVISPDFYRKIMACLAKDAFQLFLQNHILPQKCLSKICHDCKLKLLFQVTMMLVCTTLGVPLPTAHNDLVEMSDESSGETEISRGSSAILSELDHQDSFAPDTPPQNLSLLASNCSSVRQPY